MMNVVNFLRAIDGQAALCAANGQFLGLVSSNQFHPLSICNPNGMHGSSYHVTSVQNPYGIYGGPYGLYSPYNPYSIQPPVIIYQNQIVLTVSKNPYAISNVSVIDPDMLFSIYNSASLHR